MHEVQCYKNNKTAQTRRIEENDQGEYIEHYDYYRCRTVAAFICFVIDANANISLTRTSTARIENRDAVAAIHAMRWCALIHFVPFCSLMVSSRLRSIPMFSICAQFIAFANDDDDRSSGGIPSPAFFIYIDIYLLIWSEFTVLEHKILDRNRIKKNAHAMMADTKTHIIFCIYTEISAATILCWSIGLRLHVVDLDRVGSRVHWLFFRCSAWADEWKRQIKALPLFTLSHMAEMAEMEGSQNEQRQTMNDENRNDRIILSSSASASWTPFHRITSIHSRSSTSIGRG